MDTWEERMMPIMRRHVVEGKRLSASEEDRAEHYVCRHVTADRNREIYGHKTV